MVNLPPVLDCICDLDGKEDLTAKATKTAKRAMRRFTSKDLVPGQAPGRAFVIFEVVVVR